jgi:predicted MFS family arabinose efflux permease
MALNRTLSTAGTPLGAACAGVVATAFGVRSAPALAVAVSAAAIVLLAVLTGRRAMARSGESTWHEEGDDLSKAFSPR